MNVDVDVASLGAQLCNWRRWGDEDECGTVNFISPTVTRRAAQLVRTGDVFSLGVPLDDKGPAVSAGRRFNPRHYMSVLPNEVLRDGDVGIADDVLILPLQSSTQWDSLAHVAFQGQLYGGRSASLVTSAGAAVNDVCHVASRVATRGVLLDVARHRHVDTLEPGEAIEAGELQAVAESIGIGVREGDVLLIRTGYLQYCRSRDWAGYADSTPGLGMSTLAWMSDLRVAGVATDTYAVEVKPYQVDKLASPFHVVALVYMGLLLGEIFDLEFLANSCEADGRYDFFLIGSGLPVTAAVGTPVNPLAIR